MTRRMPAIQISTLYTSQKERTEDTYMIHDDGQQITLMVADGAGQRLKTTGSMKPLLDTYEFGITPARYAASLTRDVTAEMCVINPEIPVKDIVLAANQRLRESLESIYGEISSAAVLEKEPTLTTLRDDPRLFRLILPVCCITLARLDLENGSLSYVHGGDTALFLLYKDGQTIQATPDQMVQHDDKVRREIKDLIQNNPPRNEADIANIKSQVHSTNIQNGIFHNFEDEQGNPDVSIGVGVINGLPQLEEYVVTDSVEVDELDGIVVTSDGMLWPAPVDETPEEAKTRINHMGDIIRQKGLEGYLHDLHQEERSDEYGQRYQTFGKLDDATAIYVQFSTK